MKATAIPVPEIMAIVDLGYARDFERWLETIRRLSELPADPGLCVQIRAKSLPSEDLEKTAKQAREVFQNRSVYLSWNGDPRIAAKCNYDGCHQPQTAIGKLPKRYSHLIHSASIHDKTSLQLAESCGVNFTVLGPVFEPSWKKVQALGIGELGRLASLANKPVLAIGGVNVDSVTQISRTCVCGVACLSNVMDAQDPVKVVVALLRRWRQSQRRLHHG